MRIKEFFTVFLNSIIGTHFPEPETNSSNVGYPVEVYSDIDTVEGNLYWVQSMLRRRYQYKLAVAAERRYRRYNINPDSTDSEDKSPPPPRRRVRRHKRPPAKRPRLTKPVLMMYHKGCRIDSTNLVPSREWFIQKFIMENRERASEAYFADAETSSDLD